MKKIILLQVFITLFILQINAQLKVDDIGRIKVGSERLNQDTDMAANMLIFGNNGDFKAGGKLTFGDFGCFAKNSWNVFLGEYGTDDSDQLWLHAKRGIYMTYYNSTSVIAYYDTSIGNRFNFNCDVYSSGIKLTSDERLKENIKPIENSLTALRKLNGISYHLKPVQAMIVSSELSKVSSTELSEKEKKDKAFFEEWEKKLSTEQDLRLGFSAQELQKVFPDLVSEDKEGMLSVDYIGLIPVIVEAIKEQQLLIDELNEKIENLESNSLISFKKTIVSQETEVNALSETSGAALYQNTPNPFSQSTQIKYYLPQETATAYLCIYNMQGRQLKQITLTDRGEGYQVVSGAEFPAGIYLYALLVDGKEIDTKRMILTE